MQFDLRHLNGILQKKISYLLIHKTNAEKYFRMYFLFVSFHVYLFFFFLSTFFIFILLFSSFCKLKEKKIALSLVNLHKL